MLLLIDIEELNNPNIRIRDKVVPLECMNCGGVFFKRKMDVQETIKNTDGGCKYCSVNCSGMAHRKPKKEKIPFVSKKITCICGFCKKSFIVYPSQLSMTRKSLRKSPDLVFCSVSCGGKFYWKEKFSKVKKTNRSNLERYIESKLKIDFPDLEIKFNEKQLIYRAELDIYFPTLKLAFEFNGPAHYEPIFGQKELDKRQANDKRKSRECLIRGINLVIFDVRKPRFNHIVGDSYYLIIKDYIEKAISQELASL